MLGVSFVETVIKTRFNPERYKVCWMAESFEMQQAQEIKVVHLWVAKKKSPSLSHLQKLTQYMQMVHDDDNDRKKGPKSIWEILGCV